MVFTPPSVPPSSGDRNPLKGGEHEANKAYEAYEAHEANGPNGPNGPAGSLLEGGGVGAGGRGHHVQRQHGGERRGDAC